MAWLISTFVILMLFWQAKLSVSENVNITTPPVQLNCTAGVSNIYNWTWTARDGAVKTWQSSTISYVVTSNADVGKYVCTSNDSHIANYVATSTFDPKISHHGQSLTLTQGSTNKTLSCTSNSYPFPRFAWTRKVDSSATVEKLQASPNYIITENGAGTSTLLIKDVRGDSRGEYTCSATSQNVTRSATLLVRVHSNIAFLWPLIGILVEIVVILCIILVVRRQSAKAAETVLLSPQADGSSHSDTPEPSGVRQRSVKT